MSGAKRDPAIQARFDAWGRWLHASAGGGGSAHPLARLMDWASGHRADAGPTGPMRAYVPVDHIECAATDEAIRSLPDDLADAVRAWHGTQSGTLDSVAAQLGIVRGTLHRRLCQADRRVTEWLHERSRKRRVRDAETS